ncbi:hypothetical protein D0B32_00480 [Paraburkholderia sp. DHOC27]|nr:hypothetical protein D0B32_00480 [Paraburkholderia sp. DHOC27]
MQFLDRTQRTRAQLTADLQEAYSAGASLSDPCLSGQVAAMPASAYAALASQYPKSYQPLPPSTANLSAAALVSGSATAALGASFAVKFSFTNLDNLVPAGFLPFFSPLGPTLDGRVFGTAYDSNANGYVSVYQGGTIKALAAGYANVVSHLGLVGGYVITDPVNYYQQAAVFVGNNVQLIPRVQGEVSSFVQAINDFGLLIVASIDASGNETHYLYRNGKASVIKISVSGLQTVLTGMNDSGVIVGYEILPGFQYLAFKYVSATGTTTPLPPLPTEPNSWALGINELGDVVGYSFVSGGIERVGLWQGNSSFTPYFVEGTPAVPTVSNSLLVNDLRQIVITFTNDGQSYLVPQKGVRVALVNTIAYDPSVNGTPSYIFGLSDFDVFSGTTSLGIDFVAAPRLP